MVCLWSCTRARRLHKPQPQESPTPPGPISSRSTRSRCGRSSPRSDLRAASRLVADPLNGLRCSPVFNLGGAELLVLLGGVVILLVVTYPLVTVARVAWKGREP